MHRVGLSSQARNPVRLRLAAKKIDELEARIAVRSVECDELRDNRKCGLLLLRADGAILLHAPKHIVEALLSAVGMAVGIKIARALDQASQHGAFGQREALGRFAKIVARGRLDAPRAAPEIHRVQVKFENLFFAQRIFETRRHYHFTDLALIGHVISDQQILHDLLGNGRATLRPTSVAEISDKGADDAALIDAMVLKEAPILSGDECLLHLIGNIADWNPDAPVAGLEHLSVGLFLVVQYHAHARELPAFQLQGIRQFGGSAIEKLDNLAEINDGIADVLTLAIAELVVSGMQIVKIKAVKSFDVGAHRFGIIKRGRDQLIEIDGLDIERLLDVGAAGAQNLHHLVAVSHRIEVRFHRLWLGQDLTERERGRKNLNEDRVHGDGPL